MGDKVMQQQLLPLAPSGLASGHVAGLAPVYAENVIGDYIESLVGEAIQTHPSCEVVWLYFRCVTGDQQQGWAVVKATAFATKWGKSIANVGTYDAGAHGLLIYVGIHVRGKFVSA